MLMLLLLMAACGCCNAQVDWEAAKACPPARDCALPMGITSENVASQYGVSRADQDAFAATSHAKAAAAQKNGRYAHAT
jgi:acetyl-CoA acetyltransferase